ncbi:MAG: ribulose phosphate epimerase [Klenkia sp.]|nr:ribulose phosphate epimerase [Klenkia sp.]
MPCGPARRRRLRCALSSCGGRPDDVVLVSGDGEVLAGHGRRHAEHPIHSEVVQARPDVGSVVHARSPAAVASDSLTVPLVPVSHEATVFTPPDVPRFTDTSDLILTADLGRRVAAVLADRKACLLVDHGWSWRLRTSRPPSAPRTCSIARARCS